MKKRFGLLTIALAISLCINSLVVFVGAKDDALVATETISITGDEIAIDIKAKLLDTGASISDDSVVTLAPLSNSNANALVVTNETASGTTKDILLLIDNNGEVGIDTLSQISTRDSRPVEFPPESWDGKLVIRATASYIQPTGNYYRPLGLSCYYTKYEECSVEYIQTYYLTEGIACSYPGYQSLGYDEGYTITISQSNPAESRLYTKNDPYDSDKVIFTGSGSFNFGTFMTFEFTVDGEDYFHTVPFTTVD